MNNNDNRIKPNRPEDTLAAEGRKDRPTAKPLFPEAGTTVAIHVKCMSSTSEGLMRNSEPRRVPARRLRVRCFRAHDGRRLSYADNRKATHLRSRVIYVEAAASEEGLRLIRGEIEKLLCNLAIFTKYLSDLTPPRRRPVPARKPHLIIPRSRLEIEINGIKIRTSAAQQVLMLFLAEPSTKSVRAKILSHKEAIEPLRRFSQELAANCPSDGDWRRFAQLRPGFNEENIKRLLSELRVRARCAGREAEVLAEVLPKRGRFALDQDRVTVSVLD